LAACNTLEDYAATFETLTPPAELKIFIGKEADYRNPEQTVNVLKFAQVQPAFEQISFGLDANSTSLG
jgi:hypothetical protein